MGISSILVLHADDRCHREGGRSLDIDFEEMYNRYFKDVYLFVLTLSKNPALAEDITQETFFRALKEIRHFQGSCTMKSWLCQIAKNLYISHLRRQKYTVDKEMPVLSSSVDIEQTYLKKEAALSIYGVLHTLDEPYKEVFLLRTLGELTYREIGDIFCHSETWARVTYHRARLKIRELLADK